MKKNMIFKVLCVLVAMSLVGGWMFYSNPTRANLSYADMVNLPLSSNLPIIKPVITTQTYNLPLVRGLSINKDNALNMSFYFDTMNEKKLSPQDTQRMISYFFECLTVSEDKLWVNLSPYEEDSIIPATIKRLNIGKDMLIEDYLLKQLTGYLTNPKTSYGKKYWARVNEEVYKLTKSRNAPIDTFYKVWIVPEKVTFYKHNDMIFIHDATLDVMMEEEYRASDAAAKGSVRGQELLTEIQLKMKEIFKQELLPVIKQQVNNSAMFAPLRQLYYAFLLASYYKDSLSKDPYYQYYINKEKTRPLLLPETVNPEKTVYDSYLRVSQDGSYQITSTYVDPVTKRKTSRKYFSGGIQGEGGTAVVKDVTNEQIIRSFIDQPIKVDLQVVNPIQDQILELAREARSGFLKILRDNLGFGRNASDAVAVNELLQKLSQITGVLEEQTVEGNKVIKINRSKITDENLKQIVDFLYDNTRSTAEAINYKLNDVWYIVGFAEDLNNRVLNHEKIEIGFRKKGFNSTQAHYLTRLEEAKAEIDRQIEAKMAGRTQDQLTDLEKVDIKRLKDAKDNITFTQNDTLKKLEEKREDLNKQLESAKNELTIIEERFVGVGEKAVVDAALQSAKQKVADLNAQLAEIAQQQEALGTATNNQGEEGPKADDVGGIALSTQWLGKSGPSAGLANIKLTSPAWFEGISPRVVSVSIDKDFSK